MKPGGIILAGGKSSRLGRDKAFVEVGGRPVIERVIDSLRSVCARLIISANDPAPFDRYGLPVVKDVFSDAGALGGIHAGLEAIKSERGLVVACDMPFLNEGLLKFMAENNGQWDALVPRWGDEYEPLHSIYRKTCLPPIVRRIREKEKRVVGFYDRITFETVKEDEIERFDPEGLSFFNINTEEDLERANKIADAQK